MISLEILLNLITELSIKVNTFNTKGKLTKVEL
jgi:hypothetical protein